MARRADIGGALLACLGVLVVFAPVLFQGKTLSTASYTLGTNGTAPFPGQDPVGERDAYRLDVSASALAFEPWAEVNALDLWDGDLPLWNPYQASGAPQAANMQSAVFDPLNLVVNLHPTPRTWDLTLIGTFLLGAIFTYLLCRVLGMTIIAAVVGGIAFSISGYFSLYSNNGFVRTFMYLPLLCLLVEWVVRTRRLLAVGALGVATCGCIVVGMPEIAIFVVGVAISYSLYRVFWGPHGGTRRQSLLALAASFAFGVALASPLLFLFLQYEGLSFNVHKGDSGVGGKTDPAQWMLNWFAPFFNGTPNSSTSTPGVMSGTRNWIGGGVLALVVLGASARTRAARLVLPFFGVLGILVFAKAYGFPLLSWVGKLPVFERVDLPSFGLPCVGFAAALVAACGVDGISRSSLASRRLAAGIVVVVVFLAWALSINRGILRAIPSRQVYFEIGLAVLMFAAVLVLSRVPAARVAAGASVAVVFLELVILAPAPFAGRHDPYVAPAWVDGLQRALADDDTARVFATDTLLFPNTATAFGLYDIRMLDALYNERYVRYLEEFVVPGFVDRFAGTTIGSNEGDTAYVGNPMFDLLGVRYVASLDPDAGFLSGLLAPGSMTELVDVRTVVAGGEPRTAIFEHAPNEIALVLPSSPLDGRLSFEYAVDDFAATRTDTDGVRFSVIGVHASGEQSEIWSDEYVLNDVARPSTAGWRRAEVEVPLTDDPIVQLLLRTDPVNNVTADWAGWTNIDLVDDSGRGLRTSGAFEEVDVIDGVHLLRNQGALPRAFVVHNVDVVDDEDAAQAAFEAASGRFANGALKVEGLDVSRQAVVEADASDLPADLIGADSTCESGNDDVTIERYDSDEVRLSVDTACEGLLVLSDTYFPGWRATVDGDDAAIYPTNIAFRGVVVPAGRSKVVFRYEPGGFRVGVVVAATALVIMCGVASMQAVRRRQRSVSEVSAP